MTKIDLGTPAGPSGSAAFRPARSLGSALFVLGVVLAGSFAAAPKVQAQAEFTIVLPRPPSNDQDGPWGEANSGTGPVPVAIGDRLDDRGGVEGRGSGQQYAPPPSRGNEIARLDFGELSSAGGQWMSTAFVRVRIFSPWGFFPPYRVSARMLRPDPEERGDLRGADFGFGVTRVRARRPILNPIFDYDPRDATKDIDDVPIFQGTVEDLGTGLPRTELFHTNQFGPGRWNEIRIAFAVGPQYFTPSAAENLVIELMAELI